MPRYGYGYGNNNRFTQTFSRGFSQGYENMEAANRQQTSIDSMIDRILVENELRQREIQDQRAFQNMQNMENYLWQMRQGGWTESQPGAEGAIQGRYGGSWMPPQTPPLPQNLQGHYQRIPSGVPGQPGQVVQIPQGERLYSTESGFQERPEAIGKMPYDKTGGKGSGSGSGAGEKMPDNVKAAYTNIRKTMATRGVSDQTIALLGAFSPESLQDEELLGKIQGEQNPRVKAMLDRNFDTIERYERKKAGVGMDTNDPFGFFNQR